MFVGTGGLPTILCMHVDGRDADHSMDYDGGIVPDRNPWDRPFRQLFHGESPYVRRITKL